MAVGLPAALLASLEAGAPIGAAAALAAATATVADPEVLHSAMGGTVVKWLVPVGASVAAGEPVLVIEAMKMESTILAHRPGILQDQLVQTGDTVSVNSAVASIVG